MRVVGRLSPLETEALDAFAAAVRARVPGVRRIVLFGSRARGEGRDDSDLDVLVVVAERTRDVRRTAQDIGFEVGLDFGLVLSPTIVVEGAWRADGAFEASVARDGVAL